MITKNAIVDTLDDRHGRAPLRMLGKGIGGSGARAERRDEGRASPSTAIADIELATI